MRPTSGTSIDYFGWSGFRIAAPDGGAVVIDPPTPAAIQADGPLYVLLTHGHPEHVAGSRACLAGDAHGPTITVVASPTVCRHLERRTRRRRVSFRPVLPGERLSLGSDLFIDTFRWRHLPLLPPGLAAALRHVGHLASRPGLAARIVLAGLGGPPAGEMLGFRLGLGGRVVVAYGEGLHRRCAASEIATQARTSPDALFLVAVEPEDEDALPGLLQAAGISAAALYEPHAAWRDAFGMRRADLDRVHRNLEAIGIRAVTLAPEAALHAADTARRV